MAKSDLKYPSRVRFPKGKQTEFILTALTNLGISETELGVLVGVHRRTVNSWKREKYLIAQPALQLICEKNEDFNPS